MSKAYDIQGDQIIFTTEFLAVPANKVIWSRDKRKGKAQAIKELSYVVFLCDNTNSNPYRNFSESTRAAVLAEDFMGDAKWEPDELIKKAIKKRLEMQETTSTRLLKSSKAAADKLGEYFENVDFEKLDRKGSPFYSARELAANLAAVGNIIKSLKILEDQVAKEQLDSNVARGGFDIGVLELPRDDIDYGEQLP